VSKQWKKNFACGVATRKSTTLFPFFQRIKDIEDSWVWVSFLLTPHLQTKSMHSQWQMKTDLRKEQFDSQ
jgi:hypothetical protein